ncbi:cytochrome c biogenesis protein CcdA [Candidatus Woesearchaeota archaeon]|nr:cytochrome c biogenesis protein CcdA [Candidatus Woesearchaeota archaeon]
MQARKLLILLACALLLATQSVVAEQEVELSIFYGQGCPHCSIALSTTENWETEYPGLVIRTYEVYTNEANRERFLDYCAQCEIEPAAVPTFFLDGKTYSGFSTNIDQELRAEIERCLIEPCVSLQASNHEREQMSKAVLLWAVLGAAAVDAINPCAFAVLIILMTTILARGKKKEALLSGLAFAASIYIMYFLMGIGLFAALQSAGLTRTFMFVVAILALILGVLNIKDYFWYGKGILMEVPRSWRPKLKKLISSVTSVPGAFFIGLLVSFFLLPCTSGPYIIILGLLANTTTQAQGLLYLLLYNLVFILPMIIITIAVYKGLAHVEDLETKRQKALKVLHLIAGIIMLLLGIGMLTAFFLGAL